MGKSRPDKCENSVGGVCALFGNGADGRVEKIKCNGYKRCPFEKVLKTVKR